MKVANINGAMAWAIVVDHIHTAKSFKSITGLTYKAWVRNKSIYYSGSNRNEGKPEDITRIDFVGSFENIKTLKKINSNTIKAFIPALNRKRSPFIGMLISSGIIE